MENTFNKVRIDKWLWAARFFKTRNLAKQAIEGGKVHCDGARVKASKDIEVGHILMIRQGQEEKTVVVTGLSQQRGDAKKAALLYQETPESLEKRTKIAAERKALGASILGPVKRPNKRNRRLIRQFKDTMRDGH